VVVERKRIALEQLSAIEGQFTTFRDRLVLCSTEEIGN
jgi:hypothetical protein